MMTILTAIVPKDELHSHSGRFIFDEKSLEVLHYNEAGDDNKGDSNYTNGLMRYQFSNMVNCGVYLFTVSDMYKEE